MLKNVLKLTAIAAAVMAASSVVSAAEAVSIEIDGKPLAAEPPAQITEGRTLVPMRAIFEALGAKIDWDAETKTVNAAAKGHNISLTVGERSLVKDGKSVELSVPAQIIDGRTFVPARAVSESLDCVVRWDGETKTVFIETDGEQKADYVKKDEPEWVTELSNGVVRPEEVELPEKYADDNCVYKEFFVMAFLPKITEVMNESDIMEKTVKTVGIDRFFEENWLSAVLTKFGANDIAIKIAEGAKAEDFTKDEVERMTKVVRFMNDRGLSYERNFSYNCTFDKDGTFRMVVAKAKTQNADEGTVFSVILKDSERGARYYLMIAEEDGSYCVCGINNNNFEIYPMALASDDGDFEDALTAPNTFLIMVDMIEKNSVEPVEIRQIDRLANIKTTIIDG